MQFENKLKHSCFEDAPPPPSFHFEMGSQLYPIQQALAFFYHLILA